MSPPPHGRVRWPLTPGSRAPDRDHTIKGCPGNALWCAIVDCVVVHAFHTTMYLTFELSLGTVFENNPVLPAI